ncbi:hypothetical protein ACFPRL_07510 [Pseudoclavibacter helvolus]
MPPCFVEREVHDGRFWALLEGDAEDAAARLARQLAFDSLHEARPVHGQEVLEADPAGVLFEVAGRDCLRQRRHGLFDVEFLGFVAHDELTAARAVVVLGAAGEPRLLDSEGEGDQVAWVVPAAMVFEFGPRVSAVEFEVGSPESGEASTPGDGLLEVVESCGVTGAVEPLREVDGRRHSRRSRRRHGVQQHGHQHVVVQDELATRRESQATGVRGRLAKAPLRDGNRLATERVDQPPDGRIALSEGKRVEDHRESGGHSPHRCRLGSTPGQRGSLDSAV